MSDPRPEVFAQLQKLAALDIPEAYMEGVAMWLDILGTHIATVDKVPLADDIEPATVFRP